MIPKPSQCFALWPLLGHPHVTRDEIVAYQNKQLGRLIAHAYNYVPYYRRLFALNGIRPQDIQRVEDLHIIPLTSREDLIDIPAEELLAKGIEPNKLILQRTAGSSGIPLSIRRTWFEEHLLQLFRLRALRKYGMKMGDKWVRIGLLPSPQAQKNPLPVRMIQGTGIYRRYFIDCLRDPSEILQTLGEIRPDVISGYPGTVSRLADVALNQNSPMIRPRFITTGGEVLSPLMRRKINEAFKTPVFDIYGSHEFNLLAWECKETGEYHVCDDGMILEVLKNGVPARPNECGEVVGTNLHSFAMPFIRYKLGDIVIRGAERCKCGQPFPTISGIQGRTIDYFKLPSGRLIHPYEITVYRIRDKFPWIRQYQMIQEREDFILFKMVTSRAPSHQEMNRLRISAEAVLEDGVTFKIMEVPKIKPDENGKFYLYRSLVKSSFAPSSTRPSDPSVR